MPEKLGASYWRARAEEARMLAESMDDRQARRDMEQIALLYDEIARRGEAQAKAHAAEAKKSG